MGQGKKRERERAPGMSNRGNGAEGRESRLHGAVRAAAVVGRPTSTARDQRR